MSNHVLLEIGMEELPARFIDHAETQLNKKAIDWLHASRIEFGEVKTFSTPRRLAVLIKDIAQHQTTIEEEVRGPKFAIAQDEDGNWTKAAIGFSKSQGKTPDDMYTKKIKNVEYLFVKNIQEGKDTFSILPDLKQIIESLQFPQTMRWGEGSFRFARPIRWIVALFNDKIIPFEVGGITSSNTTKGHRFLGREITITDPLAYQSALKEEFVVVNPEEREADIIKGIKQLEEKEGFKVQVDESLLQEVKNLIEYPTVFYGGFEKDYLKLPNEVLITSMKEHQRYFPVISTDGHTLLPYFVGVRNGNNNAIDKVVKGNEKVLRARLADASFFFEEDKKKSIDFYMNKLKTVIFQEEIGTIYNKSIQTVEIAKKIVDKLEIPKDTAHNAIRATSIAKFDLVTDMVHEFTDLQGVMGEKYAIHYGENKHTAQAIREHYLPQQANGCLPETVEGAIASVADKIATIISCFSADIIPTGSQDPHGLRRQAIGLIRILLEKNWMIPFEDIVSIGTTFYPLKDKQQQALNQFLYDRVKYVLQEQRIDTDVIQAVLHKGLQYIPYTRKKALLLSEKKNDPSFKQTQEALVRILNLAKHGEDTIIKVDDLITESEKDLYNAYLKADEAFQIAQSEQNEVEALNALSQLTTPIHHFFDHNMVMTDDEKIKRNRLALVKSISQTVYSFAELSLIEWKQHQ